MPLLKRALGVLVREDPWTRVVVFAGEAVEANILDGGELPFVAAGSKLSKGLEVAADFQPQSMVIFSDGDMTDKEQCFSMVAESSGIISCLWFRPLHSTEPNEGRKFLANLARRGGGQFRDADGNPEAAVSELLSIVRIQRALHRGHA